MRAQRRRRRGVLAEACASARRRPRSSSRRTRSSTGARTDGRGLPPGRPDRPGQPVRRLEAGRRAGGARRRTRTGARAQLGIVRTAWLFGPRGAGLPGRRSSPRPSGPGRAGEPLRVVGDEWGSPTYTRRPRRGDRRAPRRGRRRRRSTTSSTAGVATPRRLGPRRPSASRAARRRDRGRPGLDLAAAVDAAALGRPRADAAAVRRAAPAVAGRDGRLRAAAPARAAAAAA